MMEKLLPAIGEVAARMVVEMIGKAEGVEEGSSGFSPSSIVWG